MRTVHRTVSSGSVQISVSRLIFQSSFFKVIALSAGTRPEGPRRRCNTDRIFDGVVSEHKDGAGQSGQVIAQRMKYHLPLNARHQPTTSKTVTGFALFFMATSPIF